MGVPLLVTVPDKVACVAAIMGVSSPIASSAKRLYKLLIVGVYVDEE
jgi:hypothetical protein